MIVGLGIDIIEVERVKKASLSKRFMDRVYTPDEHAFFAKRGYNPQTIAGSFAAKEAVSKALGTGFGLICWKDVEILHSESGQPYVRLHRKAEQVMDQLGGKRILVTISHTREYAAAQAIIEG